MPKVPRHPQPNHIRRRPLAEARAVVAAWQQSGQPKSQWCASHDIRRSSLHSCLRRVADPSPAVPMERASFVQLRRPVMSATAMVRLQVWGSASVDLTLEQLRDLLHSKDEVAS